jgi:hypothetical protein
VTKKNADRCQVINSTVPSFWVSQNFFAVDGGQEVISARFIRPEDALAEFRRGKITFMPPPYYILSTVASILRGPENISTQREKVERLSRGLFGRMVINPRLLRDTDEEGRTILTYEGDHTRGGSTGRLHRSLVKFGNRGVRDTICTRTVAKPSNRLPLRSSCSETLIFSQKSNLRHCLLHPSFERRQYILCKISIVSLPNFVEPELTS